MTDQDTVEFTGQETLREILVAQAQRLSYDEVLARLRSIPMSKENPSRFALYVDWPSDELFARLRAENEGVFVTTLVLPDKEQPAPAFVCVIEIDAASEQAILDYCDGDPAAMRDYIHEKNTAVLVENATEMLLNIGRSDLIGDLLPVVKLDIRDLRNGVLQGMPPEVIDSVMAMLSNMGIEPPCAECENYDDCTSDAKVEIVDGTDCDCPSCQQYRADQAEATPEDNPFRVVTMKVLDA